MGSICVLVIGAYAWSAKSGWVELGGLNAENTYYNLLVQGFSAGQLNLKKEVPPDLAALADPYDPVANNPYLSTRYPLLDLSYYRGKLSLYFGVTPALVLFWPYAVLTGHYLLHRHAVVIFFSAGFLASVGLLWGVWRRYFAGVGAWVVAAGALALGWANLTPAILQRCDVYEVPISCGHALTMVTLLLLWRSMHAARRRAGWLAGASLAYGLAVGARPSLLFGAVILLAPVAMAWREGREPNQRPPLWTLPLAATGPIAVTALVLLLYNYLRFDSPFEFGNHYALSPDRQDTLQHFSLRFLRFNVGLYFLKLAHWSGHFPFVHDIAVSSAPTGHMAVQHPFGVLTNTPLVWVGLAAPLSWRGRRGAPRWALGCLGAVLVLLFGTCALTLGFYSYACLRYEVEFLSALVVLAVLGIFGLERALAERRIWRWAVRWVWGLALTASLAFNSFAMLERSGEAYLFLGRAFAKEGRLDQAISCFEKVLERQPDNAEAECDLGSALTQQGRLPEAIAHLEQALRFKPGFADAHNNLGVALRQEGRVAEAIGHYEQALRLSPDLVSAHKNLGKALFQLGRVPEALNHYETALRLQPEDPHARDNLSVVVFQLGEALAAQGKWDEAVTQYQRAIELKPDHAPAHESLGVVLTQGGRYAEAVAQFQKALALDPQLLSSLNNLAWILATVTNGAIQNVKEAVRCAERVCELTTNSEAIYLDTLGMAYSEAGRSTEAAQAAERGAALARATGNGNLAARLEDRQKHYRQGRPYHAIPKTAKP